jgi:hypothetical protein
MSAAVRSDRPSRAKPSTRATGANASKVLHHAGHLQVVRSTPKLPPSVRFLVFLRRFSTPVALGLVIGILPLYGWTALTQKSWGQRWQNLQTLRRNERHLENKTEIRNHDVTEKVQTNPKGFVPLSPQNTVFLKSQPHQPVPKRPITALPELVIDLETPLSY